MEKNIERSIKNDVYYCNYPDGVVLLAKFLDDGKIAIGEFNLSDGETRWNNTFLTESVGVPESSGKKLLLKNVVTGKQILSANGCVTMENVGPHCSAVYIAEVVDA